MATLHEKIEIKVGKVGEVQVFALQDEAEQNCTPMEGSDQKEESAETPLYDHKSPALQVDPIKLHTGVARSSEALEAAEVGSTLPGACLRSEK